MSQQINNKSFDNRIKSYSDSLSEAERTLVAYIIQHEERISAFSIYDLAKKAKVSTATISRFVKKIGYSSFQNFKIQLNAKLSPKSDDFWSELTENDSSYQILAKTFNKNISSLQSTEDLIDEKALDAVVNVLLRAKKCVFFGLGGSGAVASIAYHKFLRTPLDVHYQADFHFQQMLAAKLTAEDCAFVISHSGTNKGTLQILDILKNHHTPVVGITSFAASPLAKKSDITLISISEETSFRPEAVSSTISQISLLDSLFMIYGLRNEKTIKPLFDDVRQVIRQTRV